MTDKLGDWLQSINSNKTNLIAESDDAEAAEKAYPPFPVLRTLSYFPDTILLSNELNKRGLKEHGVSNRMHYEFLLNTIPQRKRFSRWTKPDNSEDVDLIIRHYEVNRQKAEDLLELMCKSTLQELRDAYYEGGRK